jgi:hypothetical protein
MTCCESTPMGRVSFARSMVVTWWHNAMESSSSPPSLPWINTAVGPRNNCRFEVDRGRIITDLHVGTELNPSFEITITGHSSRSAAPDLGNSSAHHISPLFISCRAFRRERKCIQAPRFQVPYQCRHRCRPPLPRIHLCFPGFPFAPHFRSVAGLPVESAVFLRRM